MPRTATAAFLLALLTTLACEDKAPSEDATDAASDTADDSASCELWEGNATYPGDCDCASPGEECLQGCVIPDGVVTCAQVCEELGETCVANECDGYTYVGGTTCPAADEWSSNVAAACDQPIPADDDPGFGVSCCCTR